MTNAGLNESPYSVHSFMLPMRWDYLPKKYTKEAGKEHFSFEDRTNLNCFMKCLLADNLNWSRKFFRINNKAENFNEFHYFHAYTTKTLFDLQQFDEKDSSIINSNKVMIYFEIDTDTNTDTYTIKLADGNIYTLALGGISLHVYNTGVVILTINLENNRYKNKEDVLMINEFGRRIYPQFLDHQYPYTHKVKETFLADSIKISIAGLGEFKDDFSDYTDLSEREVHHFDGNDFKRNWVVKVPVFIRKLFNDKFCFILDEEKPEGIRFNILTDDRMFFQCWYGNNIVSDELKEKDIDIINDNEFLLQHLINTSKTPVRGGLNYKKTRKEYPYLQNNFWYSFMFGDKAGPSIENEKMQKEITEKHTYSRWAGYGTLFGLTRDSFVAVSSDVPTLLSNKAPNLREQMKTMYYQMAVLSLAQRASVLRFSAEVSNLADIAKSDENRKLIANIKILYKNYIEFINKIYYREITPYIQGIEMYNQFQIIMELKDHVKDLDEEINELFNYVKLESDDRQNNEAQSLSRIATWFLPASFLASLFGIGFIDRDTSFTGVMDHNLWLAWGIICIGGILISLFIFNFFKSGKTWKK